jgi:hypothetical protein
MSYFVEWKPAAHDRLERMWMMAENPSLITRAASAIDGILAHDPWGADVILGNENTLIVEPLAVEFQVDEGQHKVEIIHVWMIGFLNNDGP